MEQMREGGFLISKIHQISQRIFAVLLKKYKIDEINPAQGRVLFPLWQKNNLSFHKLLEETSLSKATLSHTLENLEKAGYIKRVPSQQDKRTINIKLTKKNQILQEKYVEVSLEMSNIYYNGFNDKDLDNFENYLKRILKNLVEYSEKK